MVKGRRKVQGALSSMNITRMNMTSMNMTTRMIFMARRIEGSEGEDEALLAPPRKRVTKERDK